jgi:hypothetical protein
LYSRNGSVRFGILMVVTVKRTNLWDMTLCSLVKFTNIQWNVLLPSSGFKSKLSRL